MAGKNQVTLTFAGDSKDLEKSFDKVGGGADRMGKDVGDSFDRVGESADNLDTRAMGFRDTMTGVEDTGKGVSEIMKGNLFEGTLLLGMGFGDLASGVANFGVQFAKQAGAFVANTARMVASNVAAVATTIGGWIAMGVSALVAGAQMALAWLIGLGPIGLVIAAIGLIIGILVALGVGFDDVKAVAEAVWNFILGAIKGVFGWVRDNWPLILAILTGPIGLAVLAIVKHKDTIIRAFRAAFNWVKDAATGAKDWIVDRFNDVVSFFAGLPGRIGDIFSGLGSSLVDAVKSIWNSTLGGFGFTVPSWVPGVGGNEFRIPELHQGGMFRAPAGEREGLAMLLDGERVTRPGMGSDGDGGLTVVVNVNGSILSERDLVGVVRDALNHGGLRGAIR